MPHTDAPKHALKNQLPPERKPEKGPPYPEDPDMVLQRKLWWGQSDPEVTIPDARDFQR